MKIIEELYLKSSLIESVSHPAKSNALTININATLLITQTNTY